MAIDDKNVTNPNDNISNNRDNEEDFGDDQIVITEQQQNFIGVIEDFNDMQIDIEQFESQYDDYYEDEHEDEFLYHLPNDIRTMYPVDVSDEPPSASDVSECFSEFKGLSFEQFMEKFDNNSILSRNSSIHVDYWDTEQSIVFLMNNVPFACYPVMPKIFRIDIPEQYVEGPNVTCYHYRKCPHGTYERCIWNKLQRYTDPDTCPTPNDAGMVNILKCPHIHVVEGCGKINHFENDQIVHFAFTTINDGYMLVEERQRISFSDKLNIHTHYAFTKLDEICSMIDIVECEADLRHTNKRLESIKKKYAPCYQYYIFEDAEEIENEFPYIEAERDVMTNVMYPLHVLHV